MILTPRGRSWGDIWNVLQANSSGCFSAAGLAAGAGAGTFKSTNTSQIRINGRMRAYAATDNIVPVAPTGAPALVNTGVGQFCRCRIELGFTGDLTMRQGAIKSNLQSAPLPRKQIPFNPAAAIGSQYTSWTMAGVTKNEPIVLVTVGWVDIPASFVFGTTLFSVGGVTFYDGDPDLANGVDIAPGDRGLSQEVVTAP